MNRDRSLEDFDGLIERRLEHAIKHGELPDGSDPWRDLPPPSCTRLPRKAHAGDGSDAPEAPAKSGAEMTRVKA